MKKTLALIMAALMLCLTGCKTKGQTENNQSSQTSSVTSSEVSEDNEETSVLKIVTDIDCLSSSIRIRGDMFKNSQAKVGKSALKYILKDLGGTPNGIDVELEVLPRESVQYDSELTHLRTEIMAGGGPDVFLMSGFGGSDQMLPDNTLFQNPESAMSKGLFLALDEYVEDAQFMDMEMLNTRVMEAGCYEGSRYILPMFYRISYGHASQVIEPEDLPATWQDGVSSGDAEIRSSYAANLSAISFRQVVFGQVADNYSEELLLDQEDFFQRTKEAVQMYEEYWSETQIPYDLSGCGSWGDYHAGVFSGEAPGDNTFFAPRNSEGGLSAAVENWCAVNANTQHPEDAFFMVDMLLGRSFIRLENFWNKNKTTSTPYEVDMFWMMKVGNIPVYTDYMTSSKSYANSVLYSDMRDALAQAEEEITYVYFTSNVDRAMDGMFRELIERVENGEAIDDDALRRTTDKTYTTIKMMLAES